MLIIMLLVLQYRISLVTFEAFALKSFGYNGSGLPFYLFGMPHSLAQLLHIMAVHHISVEAEETNWLHVTNNIRARKMKQQYLEDLPESLAAPLEGVHVVLQWCCFTLAQTVHINNGHQIVKLVIGGKSHGFPHRSF